MCSKLLSGNYWRKLSSLFVLTFVFSAAAFSQEIVTVTGAVTDSASAVPLPGVSVLVQGSADGTVTDNNGQYSIRVSPNATLVFRSMGYLEKRVSVGDQRVINVILTMSGQQLDEVIVMAFGKQKKTSVTAAVSTLKGEAVAGTPITNLGNGLAGRVSGVIAKQGSGERDSTVRTYIYAVSRQQGTASRF